MAKKTAKKKSVVITPAIEKDKRLDSYDGLKDGEAFLYDGELWIKTDNTECQTATSLSTGCRDEDFCDKLVIPVDITVTWSNKE